MAVVRISDLTAATTPLAGTEILEVEQGGNSRRVTAQNIANLATASAVPVQEEGSTVVASPTAINFVGAGVTATASGSVATVTIPGGSGGVGNFVDLGRTFNVLWCAQPGSTNVSVIGSNSFTGQGTSSAGTISQSNIFTSTPRIIYSESVASTSNRVGLRDFAWMVAGVTRGGGWRITGTFGISSGASNSSHRLFFGAYNLNLSPSDVNPSTLTNIIGFGYDSADTQIQFMTNDGSGTATKTALGASFPKPSTDGATMYLAEIQRLDGGASVTWRLTNLATGDVANGTASADLPATTVLQNFYSYASVGGVNAVIGIAYSRVLLSTIF